MNSEQKFDFLQYDRSFIRDFLHNIQEIREKWKLPFYLFQEKKLLQNIREVRNCMGGGVRIAYAMKANPWIGSSAVREADYLEVCSEGELDLCIRNRIAPEQILLDGVRRTDDLLRKALDYQVAKYCVDSPGQMEQLVRMAGRGRKVFVLLRVSSGSRFGMSRQEIRQCLDLCLDREQIEIQGVQFYPGTQRNDVRRTEQELRVLEQWLVFFKENMELPVREVQFGGGIGVPCFMSEREEDFADAFQAVAAYAEQLSRDYLVTYEAGRIFAASAGFYVTEIFEKKIRDGRNIFFCAGGTNHIRYPGGMLGIRTPYLEAEYKAPLGFEQSCSLCGSLCSQEDVLARECGLDAGANQGDVVAFCNAGAYCQMVSPNLFLLMETPGFLVYNNTVKDEFSAEAVVCRYSPGYVRSKTLGEAAGAHIDRGGF